MEFEIVEEIAGVCLIVGLFVGIIYIGYLAVIQQMHVFALLLGNGWLFVALLVIGALTSAINIPVHRTKEDDLIFVNVGGCVLPVALSAYLMYANRDAVFTLNFAVVLVAAIVASRALSWYTGGEGVRIVSLFVVAASAILAHFLAPTLLAKLVFAYVTGTFGVLVGADLMHLSLIGRDGRWGDKLSVGGAGTSDAVWATGLAATFIIVVLGL